MIHEFAKNRPTVDVIKEQLGMEPAQFDKDFLAMIDKETGRRSPVRRLDEAACANSTSSPRTARPTK